MDKYDVIRYALNNNNKLPRTKPERIGAAQPAASGPSKEVSAARAARAANVIKAGKIISTGARIARGSNMLSNALQSKDVGAGSDKPKGSGGNVLGATKQETAGRMADVASRRSSVKMSPPRADINPPKKTASKPVKHPAAVKSGSTTKVSMPPPRADIGKAKAAGSGKKLTPFGAAFNKARQRGEKVFSFNGKQYTTKVKK